MSLRKSESYLKTTSMWSSREVNALREFRSKLFETEQANIAHKILQKEDNNIQFYRITPKDELPKNLQKMSFQTLNTKENCFEGIVKVHKKQSLNKIQTNVRKILRDNGEILLLSQIYNYLDDPLESSPARINHSPSQSSNEISQLEEWEKNMFQRSSLQSRFVKTKLPNIFTEDNRGNNKKQLIGKKFKLGSDYKTEVEKHLETISYSHNNETNLMLRYSMVESSSKMLKKELEEMKDLVKKEIQEKMKKLAESRKEHHRLYEEKLKLHIQQQNKDSQICKQDINGYYATTLTVQIKPQDNNLIAQEMERNEAKIGKIKKNIDLLEEETLKNEEQLKNIIMGENVYLRKSLKIGLDCRDSGLVWAIRSLRLNQNDLSAIELPKYLDKKSKVYLLNKTRNEDLLDQILEEKRNFVKEVGKDSQMQTPNHNNQRRRSSIKFDKNMIKALALDEVKETNNNTTQHEQIPKKYSRSLKKINALREQYIKNQNLFKLTQGKGGIKFGCDLAGMTGKQIYMNVSKKMKLIDFSKLKKEKNQEKRDKLLEYQAILKRIEQLHMQIEEQDLQHESHLLSQYRDQKQLFFKLAAACFGVKRAYSLIIKNFSWKNSV